MHSFSPLCADFATWVTLSGKRGAEGHPARVVSVVVIVVTVGVDIHEIVVVIGRPQPPNSSRTSCSA